MQTMLVRFYREGGHVGLLNADDFNPERHEKVLEPGGAFTINPGSGLEVRLLEPTDNNPHHTSDSSDALVVPPVILALNAAKAGELVDAAETLEQLDALEAAERANEKPAGGRKGVLAAIAKRRAALKA